MKRNRKGFTLVELVIVIAVIAILAAVLLPTFSNVIESAKQSSATQNANNAFKAYYASDATASVSDAYDTMADYKDFTIYVINGDKADYKFTVQADGSLEMASKKGTFAPGALTDMALPTKDSHQLSGTCKVYGYEKVYIVSPTTLASMTTPWTPNA